MALSFFLVIPTFNSAVYLDRALRSILLQEGQFDLTLHIQDGASTDDTLAIVEWWRDALAENGGLTRGLGRRTLTLSSEPDGGIYEAVAKGFARAPQGSDVVMGWSGSDDILVEGALATVNSALSAFPEVQWVNGIDSTVNGEGVQRTVRSPYFFFPQLVRDGHCDGRSYQTIQQQGSFWREPLWRRVGGLDLQFKLAGDWDLWRRFSDSAELHVIASVLGIFRQRDGQLCEGLTDYWREIDDAMAVGAVPGKGPQADDLGPLETVAQAPFLVCREDDQWSLESKLVMSSCENGFGPFEGAERVAPMNEFDGKIKLAANFAFNMVYLRFRGGSTQRKIRVSFNGRDWVAGATPGTSGQLFRFGFPVPENRGLEMFIQLDPTQGPPDLWFGGAFPMALGE